MSKTTKVPVAGLADIEDPFYRYQRSVLKVTRLKNKTDLENLDQVAADLERESWMIEEYLKKKFGLSFIKKNGHTYTTKEISPIDCEMTVREFTEYFILCPQCRLPETDYKIDKRGYTMSCRCCSYVTTVQKVTDKTANKVLTSLVKTAMKSTKSN